jgi:hypothetical protein
MHHVPFAVAWLPTLMMAVGFLIAWYFYLRRPDIPVSLAREHHRTPSWEKSEPSTESAFEPDAIQSCFCEYGESGGRV